MPRKITTMPIDPQYAKEKKPKCSQFVQTEYGYCALPAKWWILDNGIRQGGHAACHIHEDCYNGLDPDPYFYTREVSDHG